MAHWWNLSIEIKYILVQETVVYCTNVCTLELLGIRVILEKGQDVNVAKEKIIEKVRKATDGNYRI